MDLQRNQLLALLTGMQYSVAAVETWGALKSVVSPLCIYLKELKTGSEETVAQPRSALLSTSQEAEIAGVSTDGLTDQEKF